MTQKTIERTASMSGRLRCAGLPRREDSTACIAERRSKMQLFVRTDKTHTVELCANDTVQDVKALIEARQGKHQDSLDTPSRGC